MNFVTGRSLAVLCVYIPIGHWWKLRGSRLLPQEVEKKMCCAWLKTPTPSGTIPNNVRTYTVLYAPIPGVKIRWIIIKKETVVINAGTSD